jgi:hypothetical protein
LDILHWAEGVEVTGDGAIWYCPYEEHHPVRRRSPDRSRTRQCANRAHTTLNEQFRRWLGKYTQRQKQADAALAVIDEVRGKLRTGGRRFTREEMNER